MPNLFGIDLAGTIAKAFSGLLLNGTLIKRASGTRTPGSLTAGTQPVETSYAFEGFIDNASDAVVGGTLVSQRGEFAVILGGSLPSGIAPDKGDKIVLESTTYTITEIPERDPAAATYRCAIEV